MNEDYHPSNKAALLEVIRSERENLETLLEGLPEPKLVTPEAEAHWSVKDILAHIAAWERVGTDIITAARDGKPLSDEIPTIFDDINQFNAQVYQQNAEASLAKVRDEYTEAHNSFMALIETLDESLIFSNLPFEDIEDLTVQYIISANTHWHYLEHAASIRAWLAED